MAPEEFRAETPRPASTLRDLNPQAGRSFTRGDRRTTPLVAIVNEALVKRQWPRAADALGRRIRFWDKSYEIVGVIASIHEWVSKTVHRRPSTCRPIRSPCHGTSLELARSLTQGAQPAAKPAVGTEDPQVSALSVRDDNRSGGGTASGADPDELGFAAATLTDGHGWSRQWAKGGIACLRGFRCLDRRSGKDRKQDPAGARQERGWQRRSGPRLEPADTCRRADPGDVRASMSPSEAEGRRPGSRRQRRLAGESSHGGTVS